jgi:hypothetical protein
LAWRPAFIAVPNLLSTYDIDGGYIVADSVARASWHDIEPHTFADISMKHHMIRGVAEG